MSEHPIETPPPQQPDDTESTRRFARPEPVPPPEEDDRTRSIPADTVHGEGDAEDDEGRSLDTHEIAPEGLQVEEATPQDLNRTALGVTDAPTPPPRPGEPTGGRSLSTEQIKSAGLSVHEQAEEIDRTSIVRHEEEPAEEEEIGAPPPEERTSRGTPVSVARIDEIQNQPTEAELPEPVKPPSPLEEPTQFGTPVSVALVDAVPKVAQEAAQAFKAREATPLPRKPKTEPEPAKIELLPGEAAEQPPEPPYNLRPATSDESTDSMTSGAAKKAAGAPRKSIWIASGVFVGLIAFLYIYLAPPSMITYPFPAVKAQAEKSPSPVLVKGAGNWIERDNFFIGTTAEPAALHVYDSGGNPPIFVGSASLPALPEKLDSVALVGTPQLDGYVLAWAVGGSVHWKALDDLQPSLKTPIMKAPPASEIPLRPREEVLFHPVRIEDWGGKSPDWFVVAVRGPDHDSLLSIEPLHSDKQILELEGAMDIGKILAEPISFFDQDEGGGSRILLITTQGMTLLGASAGVIKPLGTGPGIVKFESAWDAASLAGVKRARMGPGEKGWVVAGNDGYAAFALVAGKNLSKVAEAKWAGVAGADEKTKAPAVITFPDADHPEHDHIVVIFADGRVSWISHDEKDGSKIDNLTLPGTDAVAADLNGDGFWDLLGVSGDGKFWVVDGRTKGLMENGINGEPAPVGSEVAWDKDGDTLRAFYFSKTGDPVRIDFPLQNLGRKELTEAVGREWEWREGKRPL